MDDHAPDAFLTLPADLVGATLVGLLIGLVTGVVLLRSYPPGRDGVTPIVLTLVASIALVVALYFAVARFWSIRAADWLLAGYALGLVVFASFCITRETIDFFRHHTSSQIGVSVA